MANEEIGTEIEFEVFPSVSWGRRGEQVRSAYRCAPARAEGAEVTLRCEHEPEPPGQPGGDRALPLARLEESGGVEIRHLSSDILAFEHGVNAGPFPPDKQAEVLEARRAEIKAELEERMRGL
jgi:hypothetical protein